MHTWNIGPEYSTYKHCFSTRNFMVVFDYFRICYKMRALFTARIS